MIKFIKKHKLNFISYFLCAFAMALFTFISFNCKTYAYSIDNNGNLIGDNVFDVNSVQLGNGYDYQATASDWVKAIDIPVLPNTTYSSSSSIGRYSFNHGNIVSNYNQSTITTLSDTNSLSLFFYVGDFSGTPYDWFKYYMLNIGDTSKPWEPYGIWYSQANYDTLENQLNTTNGLLDLQIDITKYGWLSYIDNLEYYVTGNYVSTFTFNDLKTNNYISNNATLDLYNMSLYQNPNYSYIKFDIYFQNSYANLDYFSANLFDISTKLGFNGVVSIYDNNNNSAVFNITDIVSITYEDIIEKNSNFGDYIYNVVFEFASPDAATMIYTNSFYSRGYQTGYSYGSNVSTGYYTPIINDLNARISNLENDILSLNNTIDTLKELNQQYQQQLADNVGWSSLFFAFADTPFKVVSNVLGFELFGLNLFATFIGMITVFGVVYLLKKFL